MNPGIVERVLSYTKNDSRSIISVCGLGGVGKTQFCKSLINELQDPCTHIQLDWYVIDSSKTRQHKIEAVFRKHLAYDPDQYSNPYHWYDWRRFRSDLRKLKHDGELVIDDAWDQHTGNKDLRIDIRIPKGSVIVCEGIYMFDPVVQEVTDLTIVIEITSALARVRAENRDSHRSNQEYLEKKEKLAQFYEVPYIDKNSIKLI